MEKVSREQKYQQMRETLNEKQWRQYLAVQAKERGTIAEVGSRGQSLQEYGETGNERARSRRDLSTRRADSKGRGRKKTAGADRYHPAL
jgi:hypothetical protein